jgi:hypothetical protein
MTTEGAARTTEDETTTLTPGLFPMIDMDTAANAIPTEKEPSEANSTAIGG